MQFLCRVLVGVCLDAQSFLNGEDFEQKGKTAIRDGEALDDRHPDQLWICCEVIRERGARRYHR